jgi:hypothetical protein
MQESTLTGSSQLARVLRQLGRNVPKNSFFWQHGKGWGRVGPGPGPAAINQQPLSRGGKSRRDHAVVADTARDMASESKEGLAERQTRRFKKAEPNDGGRKG